MVFTNEASKVKDPVARRVLALATALFFALALSVPALAQDMDSDSDAAPEIEAPALPSTESLEGVEESLEDAVSLEETETEIDSALDSEIEDAEEAVEAAEAEADDGFDDFDDRPGASSIDDQERIAELEDDIQALREELDKSRQETKTVGPC